MHKTNSCFEKKQGVADRKGWRRTHGRRAPKSRSLSSGLAKPKYGLLTVGPGITPGLLTLSFRTSARGLGRGHYRRWGIAPRPENVGPVMARRSFYHKRARFAASAQAGGGYGDQRQRLWNAHRRREPLPKYFIAGAKLPFRLPVHSQRTCYLLSWERIYPRAFHGRSYSRRCNRQRQNAFQ